MRTRKNHLYEMGGYKIRNYCKSLVGMPTTSIRLQQVLTKVLKPLTSNRTCITLRMVARKTLKELHILET